MLVSPFLAFGGVSTEDTGHPLHEYAMLNPTRYHRFWDDFDSYTAADWVVTETGSATQVIADENGGVLLITNAAADNDASFQQWAAETFKLISDRRLFFQARFKLSDVTQSDAVIGLQITDTSPLAVSDGLFFLKTDGAATIDFVSTKNSVSTTLSAIATLTNDTFVEVAFAFDGQDQVRVFVDEKNLGTIATNNIPTDEELTVSFGVQNGAAAAKTMSLDYIFCAAQR